MREDKEDWAGDPPRRGSWWAMLLLKVMVLECWCCPRHADRQGCAVAAILLLWHGKNVRGADPNDLEQKILVRGLSDEF